MQEFATLASSTRIENRAMAGFEESDQTLKPSHSRISRIDRKQRIVGFARTVALWCEPVGL